MQDKRPKPGREARRPWTEEEIDLLLREWNDSDAATIAVQLGRTEAAVSVKASRIGLSHPGDPLSGGNDLRRQRRCLMCNNLFNSTGPGNHICAPCKDSEEWQSYTDPYPFLFNPPSSK